MRTHHLPLRLSPGDPEHLSASCYPAVGVQVQSRDGTHPSESGRPPDYHGGQRKQLPKYYR